MLGGKHDESPNHAHDESAPAHGHYADKELAEAYLKINDLTHARAHAETELSRRPENIEVNELMAWVFYKIGEPQKALPFIEKALRTHIKNPKTLWKAGQIFLQTGQEKRGNELVQSAFKINKNLKTSIL
ncbi:MAG: hypothetical protein HC817_07635 [Saprospiraceae bacterium]|nr:hypothetical protein [Saprospiraceae bacterium]